MINNRKQITTTWFFSEPPALLKHLSIFVKGDALVMVPFLIILVMLLIISLRFGLVVFGIFFATRGLGEMIYWLLQQFGPKTYRPWDYGLKNLNNEGVYIIYQLTSMIHVIVGVTLVFYVLFFTK